jgi:NDP-sugar pyrophosphorylase family protein
MYGFVHSGFWLDIGNPDVYMLANMQLLRGAVPTRRPEGWPSDDLEIASAHVEATANIRAPLLLGRDTAVAATAQLESTVSGRHCTIAPGAHVRGSVLWDDVVVEEGADVSDSVLADGVHIGPRATVRGAVLAHGASVAADEHVPPGTRVAPDVEWTGVPA